MSEQIKVRVVDVANETLNLDEAMDFVTDDEFGGYDIFVGKIRAHSHGREVVGITYDVFDELALNNFKATADKIVSEFGPLVKIYMAHAKGRLGIGGTAVIIAVGTKHRDEAFRACRQGIEAVKHESPIWKQEHYVDGDSEWSEGCSLCH